MMSVFGEDRHLSDAPDLKPVVSSGVRCVVVERELEQIDPPAYLFLPGLARDNGLMLRLGRRIFRPHDTAP